MSTVQTQFSISHLESGLSSGASVQRESSEPAFVANVLDVTSAGETVGIGDIVTPQLVFVKHIAGDPVMIGFASDNLPMRVTPATGGGEMCVLRLDVEGRQETTTVTCEPDVGGSLEGRYFDIVDRHGPVRVWFAMDKETTSVQVASLTAGGGIGGKYFDIRDENNAVVRVWCNVSHSSTPPTFPVGGSMLEVDVSLGTKATGTVTYGTPTAATKATGTITYGTPALAATVTVAGTTFTHVASAPNASQFDSIGVLASRIAALATVDATENGSTVFISAASHGTSGNNIGLTASGFTVSGSGYLAGGINGDTFTITVADVPSVFTCVDADPSAGQFDDAAGLEALIEAVSGVDASLDAGIITVIAASAGTAGNSIGMATSSTSGLAPNNSVLSGGTEPDTPSTVAASIAARLSDYRGLTATATGDTVVVVNNDPGSRDNATNAGGPATFTIAISVDGTNAPSAPAAVAPQTSRLLQVNIALGASADTIAAAVAAVINGDAEFSATSNGAAVTIVDQHTGTRSAATVTGGNSGWADPVSSGTGAASPIVHLKSTGSSQVLVAVAPN